MNKRNTLQKDITFQTIKEMHDHPTAEEVYSAVHINYPSISKATVYRNLADLEESGAVKRIRKVGSGSDRYDCNTSFHYHAKCSECGKVFDVNLDIREDLLSLARSMYGKVTSYDIIFKGICAHCAQEEK